MVYAHSIVVIECWNSDKIHLSKSALTYFIFQVNLILLFFLFSSVVNIKCKDEEYEGKVQLEKQ